MPATVADLDTLQRYVRGVIKRADHHGHTVDEIVLAIAGAVIWRHDSGTDLEVRTHAGSMANVLWFCVGDTRYAVKYNHKAKTVEVREGTTRGTLLESFTNASTSAEVKRFFESL